MKTIKLSERMQAIADLVMPGFAVADIGTDHGYIAAYLTKNNICPKVILSDIADGPLKRAEENFENLALPKPDLRLGSGLSVLNPGEVFTAVIAGMGGELIEAILKDNPEITNSIKRFVLQPRSRIDNLRLNLKSMGFNIVDYNLALERGRICEIFAIEKSENLSDENPVISDKLLDSKPLLLKDFINYKIHLREEMISNLNKSASSKNEEINNIQEEIIYLNNCLQKLS